MFSHHGTIGRRLAAGCTTLAALAALVAWRAAVAPSGNVTVLAADDGWRWYRGNIHTHTFWSDGDDYPEMVALWYKDRGYDFLCFTDHNTLLENERWVDASKDARAAAALDKLRQRFPKGWVHERQSAEGQLEIRLKTFAEIVGRVAEEGRFLLIQGEEISDKFGKLPIHMNAGNLSELIPPLGGDSVYGVMQRTTDALLAQRERTGRPMLIHLNHPNFGYAVTAEDLMRVRGENFFEVYNGHPTIHNSGDDTHVSTERMWDIINALRLTDLRLPLMYGLAVDDGHNYHDIPSRKAEPGRGWIYVLARALTPAALFESLEAGRFYSSSGVRLKKLAASEKHLELAVDAEPGVDYTIEFISTRRGFDRASQPVLSADGQPLPVTRRYSDDIGRVSIRVSGTQAAYQFAPDELYVRARVTSSKKHPNPSEPGEFERAWTQPVRGPAGN